MSKLDIEDLVALSGNDEIKCSECHIGCLPSPSGRDLVRASDLAMEAVEDVANGGSGFRICGYCGCVMVKP